MTTTTITPDEVIQANIALHTSAVDEYNAEPHFRQENIAKVDKKLKQIIDQVQAKSLLDLGCDTGFIIDIAKKYVSTIDGVDVTQAMLNKVNQSGTANIRLFNEDTGTFAPEKEAYDVVTAYAFLHHLYDVAPTLKTAHTALRPGGQFYIDLEPNHHFWAEIDKLDRKGDYDPIVKKEVEMVSHIDEQVGERFGIDHNIINLAEYGKNICGGFKAEALKQQLLDLGFKSVKIEYFWYIGQANLINDPSYTEQERFQYADVMDSVLQKTLPLSRGLYKYFGLIATK